MVFSEVKLFLTWNPKFKEFTGISKLAKIVIAPTQR